MNHSLHAWNLSPEQLFAESWARFFLREQVDPSTCAEVCNIGIGDGTFDRWLGYWLHGHGTVTSVDIDEGPIGALAEEQAREGHPNPARIVHADMMQITPGPFDLVTVVGSTLHETHVPGQALRHARGWVRPGGRLYLTLPHTMGDPERLLAQVPGIVAKRSFTEMPGAELTAALVAC